jgi:hypothetical protein
MKTNRQRNVMMILIAACCFVYVRDSAIAQLATNGAPIFGAVGKDIYGSDIERRLSLIQDSLGIQDYGFRYYIPMDTKLLLTLSVKINGQLDKNAGGTYQIALSPKDYAEERVNPFGNAPGFPNGFISITRSPSPGAESKERDVRWGVVLGRRYDYKFTVPRDIFDGPGFEQMRQCASDNPLIMGKDEEVFAYELFREDKKTEKFSIRMTVRLETRRSDDKPGIVLLHKNNKDEPN